jgi:hypothetical protein
MPERSNNDVYPQDQQTLARMLFGLWGVNGNDATLPVLGQAGTTASVPGLNMAPPTSQYPLAAPIVAGIGIRG